MKKEKDKLGLFGICGAVLSLLIGYPLSGVLCDTFEIESIAIVAAIYFGVTVFFAWIFIKIGGIIDKRRDEKRKNREADNEDDF